MRITSEVMVTRSLERLNSRLQTYERKQSELALGKRIIQASDDPAGARRGSSLRAALKAREQDVRNADEAGGWLATADGQLQSASERMVRLRELVTQGASHADPQVREAIAIEVRAIAEELAGIANTTYNDRPLFGGFDGGPAVEKVAGVWTSAGDGDQVTRRVSDSELVRINITAGEWLGFGAPGGDLLTQLDELADDLVAGDQTKISGHLGRLAVASDRITDGLATIGAATNRIESASARASELLLTLRTELSKVEDVDVAESVMELQVQQVAYEATLQALGRALPPSLVAFLR